MDFHKILAENLLRFGVKNLDHKQLNKFLLEQDQASLIQSLKDDAATYKMFKDWENQTQGLVKLVKTYGYRPVPAQINKVKVPFFNNFVTIDQGSPKPAEMKKQLDLVLESLKQAGANLDSPETIIDIISTATPPVAGTNIDKAAAAAGRKTIDHNYGLSGDIKTELANKQKTDDQWGNTYLATKRGESAKAYIESKGIKAKINVIVKIKQPERMFEIIAKVKGQEKFVAPINVPTPKITLTFDMAPSLISRRQAGTFGGGASDYTVDVPIFSVNFVVETNFGMNGSNTTMQSRAGANRGWADMQIIQNSIRKGYMWNTSLNDYYMGSGNPFKAFNKGDVEGTNNSTGYISQQQSNMSPETFLSSIGHFTLAQARQINLELMSAISPLGTKLLGVDIPGTVNQFATFLRTPDWLTQFKSKASQYSIPRKTVEVSIDQLVAAVGGSPDLSADVKYWGQSVYYDATQTPPTYGPIAKNPTFFDGVKLATK
jgi:hypothetical protein